MNYTYKIMNHFRNAMRTGANLGIWEQDENFIWISDNYTAAKIHKNEMELNPKKFKDVNLQTVVESLVSGSILTPSKMIERYFEKQLVPLKGLEEVVWVDKAKLDLFSGLNLSGKGALKPVAVLSLTSLPVGIILPYRHDKEPDLFNGLEL